MRATDKPFYSRNPKVVTDRILDAAEAEFVAAGFSGASTNKIIERFGGSRGTVFRHYPTKADLFIGVIRRIGERLVSSIAWGTLGDGEPRDWLVAFSRLALRAVLADDAIFVGRMVVAHGRDFPIARETFVSVAVQPMLDAVADKLRLWTDAGMIVSEEPEADAVLFFDVVMSGWISRTLFGLGPDVDEAFLDREAQRSVGLFLEGRKPHR